MPHAGVTVAIYGYLAIYQDNVLLHFTKAAILLSALVKIVMVTPAGEFVAI